jgi:hypothetical protein
LDGCNPINTEITHITAPPPVAAVVAVVARAVRPEVLGAWQGWKAYPLLGGFSWYFTHRKIFIYGS